MASAKKNGKNSVAALWGRLAEGDFSALDERLLTDQELLALADTVKHHAAFGEVFHLVDALPTRGHAYDWNVGGLLQHFDADLIMSAVQHAGDPKALYESVGLAWAFGQLRNRHGIIVEHLYATVREADNGEAWWQAAFSLEKLGEDDAVNLLKRSLKQAKAASIEEHLRHLDDKRALIGILLQCEEDTALQLYPKVKTALFKNHSDSVIANCCFLIGRLRLVDEEIVAKLLALAAKGSYEIKQYAYYALQNNANESMRPFFELGLRGTDALTRKLACRGLRALGGDRSLAAVESALMDEKDASVSFELSKTIYRLKNAANRDRLQIKRKSSRFENGMITAAEPDPLKLNLYAEGQDPENLCFSLIRKSLGKKKPLNPIDMSARTGRALRQAFDLIPYEGTLYGLDPSKEMCTFADKSLRRERHLTRKAKVLQGTLADVAKREKLSSSLIVSSFGFPSENVRETLRQMKAIHDTLTTDGLFITVGWDELYNDALTAMWFKYVPDGIQARNYQEWREQRMATTVTRTSCGLTWLHRGLHVPLQFRSLEESARVMGHLFGRDAAQYVVRNGRTEWGMSLGITCDTKKSLKKAIQQMEAVLA